MHWLIRLILAGNKHYNLEQMQNLVELNFPTEKPKLELREPLDLVKAHEDCLASWEPLGVFVSLHQVQWFTELKLWKAMTWMNEKLHGHALGNSSDNGCVKAAGGEQVMEREIRLRLGNESNYLGDRVHKDNAVWVCCIAQGYGSRRKQRLWFKSRGCPMRDAFKRLQVSLPKPAKLQPCISVNRFGF